MKKVNLFITLLIILSTLSACSASSNEKVVTWNSTTEPPVMNSVLSTSSFTSDVLRHVMDGLIQLDENDAPIPAIAKSWDISSEGTVYTFKLREDALWSNGDSVTAHDFVFAFNLLFNPNTAASYAGTWAPLIQGAQSTLDLQTQYPESPVPEDVVASSLDAIGYKAIDDYTLEMTLTKPYEFFIGLLAFSNFYPINEKAFNELGGIDEYAKDAESMLYNGAFEITEWIHDSKITMSKRADYYDVNLINLDKIIFQMIADSNTALNAFESGEIDITEVTGQQAQELTANGTQVNSFDLGSSAYLEFNTANTGLNNIKIRKAITLALDAQQYVDKIVMNNASVANSFVPQAIAQGQLYNAVGDLLNRPATGEMTDVVKLFEEGLKEEGLTRETFKIEFITDDSALSKKFGAYMQEQMKTVLGIEIEIAEMTWKSIIEHMNNKNFDVIMTGWSPDYNDPMTFLDLMQSTSGNNHTSWSNSRYDELVSLARSEIDATKRIAYMVEMEKILADEMPIGYVYNRSASYVKNDRVINSRRSAFTKISLKYADITE